MRPERGISIVEVMVAMSIFAFVTLGIARSQALSSSVTTRTIHSSKAMQIALEQLESYTTLDPLTLDDTDDYNDVVSRGTARFNRTVDITVNSDESRTVKITIVDQNVTVNSRAEIQLTLATQGSS